MKIGVIGNVMVISANKNESSSTGKTYYSLAVVGTDGYADNINTDESVYNLVSGKDFIKPCMYEVNFEFSSGQSNKGRYSYLRAISVGKKIG